MTKTGLPLELQVFGFSTPFLKFMVALDLIQPANYGDGIHRPYSDYDIVSHDFRLDDKVEAFEKRTGTGLFEVYDVVDLMKSSLITRRYSRRLRDAYDVKTKLDNKYGFLTNRTERFRNRTTFGTSLERIYYEWLVQGYPDAERSITLLKYQQMYMRLAFLYRCIPRIESWTVNYMISYAGRTVSRSRFSDDFEFAELNAILSITDIK